MPLGDEDETALFFWFVESKGNPATDPIALWLIINGLFLPS